MATESEPKRYEVKAVVGVDGPVGMDTGIWLHLDTEEGEVKLKLAHSDALALKHALDGERSLEIDPRKIVADTAGALSSLAERLGGDEDAPADQLRRHANDLRCAADKIRPLS